MRKTYLSKALTRRMSAEHPVGDPFGGAAYGEKNEPVSAFAAANSGLIAMAGVAMSVIGAVNQGQQAEAAAKYNADKDRQNAIASQQQAAANAAAQQRKARLQQGSMRAGYGASGVSIEGSPLDMLEQSATMAELDRQNIIYGGATRSQGYSASAGLNDSRASNAMPGAYMSAGSSLLMGAARASTMFNSAGVPEAGVSTVASDAYSDNVNMSFTNMLRQDG
jgi:hypothetical protein